MYGSIPFTIIIQWTAHRVRDGTCDQRRGAASCIVAKWRKVGNSANETRMTHLVDLGDPCSRPSFHNVRSLGRDKQVGCFDWSRVFVYKSQPIDPYLCPISIGMDQFAVDYHDHYSVRRGLSRPLLRAPNPRDTRESSSPSFACVQVSVPVLVSASTKCQ